MDRSARATTVSNTCACPHPVFQLSLVHTHQHVRAMLLRYGADETHELVLLLAVQLQFLAVSRAAWHGARSAARDARALLLDLPAVALHDVGHDAVGSVTLTGENFAALRARAGCATYRLAGCARAAAAPVVSNAGLAEGVIAWERHGLLE